MQVMKMRISCGDFSENLTARKRRSYGVSHSEKAKNTQKQRVVHRLHHISTLILIQN